CFCVSVCVCFSCVCVCVRFCLRVRVCVFVKCVYELPLTCDWLSLSLRLLRLLQPLIRLLTLILVKLSTRVQVKPCSTWNEMLNGNRQQTCNHGTERKQTTDM